MIVATGHQEFDARRKPALGFGRYRNVLTQSQLARLLAACGPTEGEVYRPSDGAVPKKIFMLQCVGSRDCTTSGNEHCSAICCLFATLHGSLIKQHYPDADITVGYTDMRTPGKSHEEYYRLVQTRGVRYVRGRVGEIARGARRAPAGALRGHRDGTQERGAVRPGRAFGRPRSLGRHPDIAQVAGLQTARPASSRSTTPSSPRSTPSVPVCSWPARPRAPRTSPTRSLRPRRPRRAPSRCSRAASC